MDVFFDGILYGSPYFNYGGKPFRLRPERVLTENGSKRAYSLNVYPDSPAEQPIGIFERVSDAFRFVEDHVEEI